MKPIYQKLVEQHGFSPAQKIIMELVKGGKVLEIGACSGYMTEQFIKNGCVVDVVEVNDESLKKISQDARKIILGSIEDKKIQDSIIDKYDYIICADVLEHLVYPEKVLYFLKSKLGQDGDILISIPNVACWNMRLEFLSGRFEYQESGLLDKTHLRFYTYNSFIKLLKDIGLKKIKVYPAETKIPLEYSLSKIPFLGKLFVSLIKPKLVAVFPNLTYYHYVVEVKV